MKTAEQIFREWSQDMPAQFWNKHNIDVILRSYSRQLAELYEVCEQLKNRLDIDSSSGVLLDGIGDILTMTRKGAYEILKTNKMDDDKYRKVLHYQALKESSDATYEDIMKSMRLLWNPEGIHYEEPRDLPATIHIRMDQVSLDDMDPAVGAPITIKPAGVNLTYLFNYYSWFLNAIDQIRINMVKFYAEINFFGVRIYDGLTYYDGSYNYDAERRYWLKLILGLKLGQFVTSGTIDTPSMSLAAEIPQKDETVGGEAVDIILYNGKINYDGTYNYDGVYRKESLDG